MSEDVIFAGNVPTWQQKEDAERFEQAVRDAQQFDPDTGRLPTAAEIARKLQVSVGKVRKCQAFYDYKWT
jgi:hypothetical protein